MAETLKKRILLVDNDEIVRNGMRLILESAQYDVKEATDGNNAMEMLKTEEFDLVVSDFENSEMFGVQFLTFVKTNTKSHFLLLSVFSTALQAPQAYQLGADEFLNKPFTRSEFLGAVEKALDSRNEQKTDSIDFEFIQVPIAEFLTGSKLKVDLYLRISESRYLKIGHKHGHIEQSQIESYLKRGLKWLHLRKQDFAIYVGFNITIAQRLHHEKRIECARKLRLTMHVTETLMAQLRDAGLNRQQLEDTSNVVINAMELIMSSEDTLKLLESMKIGGTLPAHSIAVGVWACLIGKQLGWTGHSTFFKIAICAIFHDIGLKELDETLANKPRFEMNREEIKAYESHTGRGRDLLTSVPGMLDDVIIVAAQHHEMYRGGGYPYGLKFQQIHPLAALVGLADRLCETLKFSEKDPGIMSAYEQLSKHSRDFDPVYFKALTQVVEHCTNKAEYNKAS